MTLLLVVLNFGGPAPDGADGSAYPSAYRAFNSLPSYFSVNLGDPFHGGKDPSELYCDAVAAAADHCADPGAPPLPVSPHPGTTRSDHGRAR